MTAEEWYTAGFHDLVCVTPPDVDLDSASSIKPDSRGKAPGRMKGKAWTGYGWAKHDAMPSDVRKWDTWGANVGLKARN